MSSGNEQERTKKEAIINHDRASFILLEIEGIFEREELDLVEEKLIFDLLKGRNTAKIGQMRANEFTNQQLNKLGISNMLGNLGLGKKK